MRYMGARDRSVSARSENLVLAQKTDQNLMIMNTFAGLPIEKLKKAVGIREQIDQLTAELNSLLGTSDSGLKHGLYVNPPRKRELSASGRARIAAAQRLRWSKYNENRPKPVKDPSKKPRLTSEGRAKVSEAVKARWERFRAAKALGMGKM